MWQRREEEVALIDVCIIEKVIPLRWQNDSSEWNQRLFSHTLSLSLSCQTMTWRFRFYAPFISSHAETRTLPSSPGLPCILTTQELPYRRLPPSISRWSIQTHKIIHSFFECTSSHPWVLHPFQWNAPNPKLCNEAGLLSLLKVLCVYLRRSFQKQSKFEKQYQNKKFAFGPTM